MIDILHKNKNVHFIGIGGAGMSGLASILHKLGYSVTGSDKADSEIVKEMRKKGIKIYKGHSQKNIKNVDLVVYSSAVKPSNPEMVASKEARIPVMRRAEMLGEIMRLNFSIAVSGTHGKTTTTSMISSVFSAAELSPTVIVGGIVRNINTNAVLGHDNYAIIEADEYDRSFLAMVPTIAVVTNIEADHLDCYRDINDIKKAFVEFCNKVPFYGCVILCLDEVHVQEIMPDIKKTVVTYGFLPQADYTIKYISNHEYKSEFEVVKQGESLGVFTLGAPGKHNIKNAVAAIVVANELEIKNKKIIKGIAQYSGVQRRFEVKGEKQGVMVVDDYAHHPTEVMETLRASKENSDRRVVAVFQPHLYSRTKDFYEEFARSFLLADIMIVTDVYASREKNIIGVTGNLIVEAVKKMGHKNAIYEEDKENIPELLKKITKKGDVVITMGAGDINLYGERFLDIL